MATIDELFATMAEETTTGAIDELLIIDPNTRQISLPGAELVFGVEGDAGSERKYFLCPRIVGNNLDLASSFVRVVYRNANGEEDAYPVTDVTLNDSGDSVMFSWELMGKVTKYKGQVKFLVYAVGPDLKTKWHTTLATGISLEGLTPDTSSVETETADVVAQLIAMVEAQTVAVENVGAEQVANVKKATVEAQNLAIGQIEAKGTEVLGSIPDDYTTVSRKVNGQANAIIGKVSGEVVRVDDVSPIEHTMGVKVRGKNLLPYPYKQETTTLNGGTFTSQSDGGVVVSGVPTAYVSLNLYDGVPLLKDGKITFSASGDYENVNISMVIYDKDATVLFTKETWKGASPITVDLSAYPSAARWLVFLKRGTPDVEMTGVLYPQMELGTVATDYTPYIDPTTVTLTRCGKNILDFNGILDGVGSSHVYENEKLTVTGYFSSYTTAMLTSGARYTISFDSTRTGEGGGGVSIEFYRADDTRITGSYKQNELSVTTSFTVPAETKKTRFYFYGSASSSGKDSATYTNLQIESGGEKTLYEPYNGTTISPTSDGTVAGLTSLSPTMTLLTDKAGVTVECEYNRDTNKVIAELLNKIAELSA